MPPATRHAYQGSQTPPVFRSITSRKGGPTVLLKVLLAQMKRGQTGKNHFYTRCQTFLDINERNTRVSEQVQARWGAESRDQLVLVTGDGLQIKDCEGTRGI